MEPRRSQPPAVTSARDCPVCGEPVHWSRYWLRAHVWAKWRCPKCGSVLGFDHGRRGLITAIAVALSIPIAFGVIRSQYSALVVMPIVLVASVVLNLLDRVTVVGHRNPSYCPGCRYDLTGTISAGLTRCPECSRQVAEEERAAARQVRSPITKSDCVSR